MNRCKCIADCGQIREGSQNVDCDAGAERDYGGVGDPGGGASVGAAHGGCAGAEGAVFAAPPAVQGGGGYAAGLYPELENGRL